MSSRARELRANSSPVERRMWRILYALRTGGYHFRKQAQIGPFVVDFACHHAKLVIEVDGDTHGTDAAEKQDAYRDCFLRGEGYAVLRIANADVLHNPDGVFRFVADALKEVPPRPRRAHPLPSPAHKGEGAPRWSYAGSDAVGEAGSPRSDTSPLVGEAGRGESRRPQETKSMRDVR